MCPEHLRKNADNHEENDSYYDSSDNTSDSTISSIDDSDETDNDTDDDTDSSISPDRSQNLKCFWNCLISNNSGRTSYPVSTHQWAWWTTCLKKNNRFQNHPSQ